MTQAVRNFTDGIIKIRDGSGREITVPADRGELTFTEREEAKVIMSRGTPIQFAKGISESQPISFVVHFTEYFSKNRSGAGADDVSVRDFLKGDYDNAESTSDCGPHTVEVRFEISSPCKPGIGDKDETIIFPFVHADEVGFQEGEESNQLTVTGKELTPVATFIRTTN